MKRIWLAHPDELSPVVRAHNRQNEIGTTTGQTTPVYDANGNEKTDFANLNFTYDAWNHTTTASTRSYELDGQGRRIEETVSGTTTDFYHSANWQTVAERVAGVLKAQYLWSAGYVDEMVLRDRDADGNAGNGLEQR